MSIRDAYVIQCDGCLVARTYLVEVPVQDAIADVEDAGWVVVNGESACCPDCPPVRVHGSR